MLMSYYLLDGSFSRKQKKSHSNPFILKDGEYFFYIFIQVKTKGWEAGVTRES